MYELFQAFQKACMMHCPFSFQCALPDDTNPPAEFNEFCLFAEVPSPIARNFLPPEILTRFRKTEKMAALVSVPETAIHE